ncbi:MAG: MarR family winged helix-turn-helix transcriptional regulator [Comamonadaceae bacterium]|nr:MarR family winged helix-turn-helix transcriptional regulator [Comamonadaceae bacterium]
MPVLRELVRCYQAFEAFSSTHIRAVGLTPAQFDIIATLGNTAGMSFKDLGERTLITKGTLTGVVDRLEARQLVRRVASETDRRSQIVQLTATARRCSRTSFPSIWRICGSGFGRLEPADLAQLEILLRRLRREFAAAERGAPEQASGAPAPALNAQPRRSQWLTEDAQ